MTFPIDFAFHAVPSCEKLPFSLNEATLLPRFFSRNPLAWASQGI
jgi:hypothetical protein